MVAALMVCEVPFHLRALVNALVPGVSGREAADTAGGYELGVYYLEDLREYFFLEGRVFDPDRGNLVGTDVHVAARAVNIVCQAA